MPYINIDPVALDLGFIKIHWYGLMYLFAFICVFCLAWLRRRTMDWQRSQIESLVFYGALGTILGGRIGYILFYNFSAFIADPWLIFKIWQGGMSFHGGLLGVMIAIALFARNHHRRFFAVADFVAPLVPLGLGFGRIGNYINGELWGKQTTSSWGVFAPDNYGIWAMRYPSQLYEALLEGLVLFLILWIYSSKPRPIMATSALFLLFYGIFRFIVEFVRQPDTHIGYLAWGWLTMGQLLSMPMIIGGIILLTQAYRHHRDINFRSY